MNKNPKVSVCVPVYNEQEVLPLLLKRVSDVLVNMEGGAHELVLIDDGSSDNTPIMLEDYASKSSQFLDIKIVFLSRNFGHQTALSAGLDHITGDVCFIIDGDLQDPPEVLPVFIDYWRKGYDVVYAKRVRRKESLWLRICYSTYYRLVHILADQALPIDAGDFSLVSRRVVNAMKSAPERSRYLRGLRSWAGFKQIAIEVERAERHAGKTKYSARKLLKLASDGIFSFSMVPLRLASVCGLIAIILASLFAIYTIFVKLLLNQSPAGFTAIIFFLTLFFGINLFFLGIIGEYVGRIYQEVKQRPLYVIDKIIEVNSKLK